MPFHQHSTLLVTPGLVAILTWHQVCAKWIGYCDNDNSLLSDGMFSVARSTVALDESVNDFDELGSPPPLTSSRIIYAIISDLTLPLLTANGVQYSRHGIMTGSGSSGLRPILGSGVVLKKPGLFGALCHWGSKPAPGKCSQGPCKNSPPKLFGDSCVIPFCL